MQSATPGVQLGTYHSAPSRFACVHSEGIGILTRLLITFGATFLIQGYFPFNLVVLVFGNNVLFFP